MKRRIKVSITLDRDHVHPDALKATMACLADMLDSAATRRLAAIDWNRVKMTARTRRNGDRKFIAKGVVL